MLCICSRFSERFKTVVKKTEDKSTSAFVGAAELEGTSYPLDKTRSRFHSTSFEDINTLLFGGTQL